MQKKMIEGREILCMEDTDIKRLLPPRDAYAHKGNFGKVTIVAGAEGYTGAPTLAAKACLRCGSGLVFTLVPRAVYPIVAGRLEEAMVFPMPCDAQGRFSQEAAVPVLERINLSTCALVGPGLGRSSALTQLVAFLLPRAQCPLILDADGLNALEGHIDILREVAVSPILTPHDGEFARLYGRMPDPRKRSDRIDCAMALARKAHAIVLLKGHRTIITDGDAVYVNFTGNPGMATGGSGDVLAGMLAALVGQGLPGLEAAALAAYLHGKAGDVCAAAMGQVGLLPGDMIAALPRLFLEG